ncbi:MULTISPECIES: hypothetical protein [unclassified Microcystis]|uniref:hypothetical protein n=2 Tax=unclassified Microcystis TaxID=2643300 RepID=UPI001196DE60|nr:MULTISPECIES: hypothetical protein [unclassified Microcystis]MCA2618053.1 hypothetical protein [Microcystis sp. M099S2]MCA2680268.1 hypothetical protein [Microcystis sp. M043S2]MCA2807572.1 hypothetical protein [Microcystis sp. M095S1]MCA2824604.1 hypothetical protein [Microcystis sp. M088S1]MCA2829659.1 hypothetical protein [Microcystis sp. M086S1]MCA2851414.1 hypothetical protein [Microcystis sp. M076S1]MCA2861820.1 hypothetical protein [Microcystis sp. M005S1]MCA2864478.1 hypothetical
MTKKPHIKLIHIGEYMAEVEVELIETPEGWSPYLSLEDAQKLDDVREALRQGDLQKAFNLAHLYKITPLTV